MLEDQMLLQALELGAAGAGAGDGSGAAAARPPWLAGSHVLTIMPGPAASRWGLGCAGWQMHSAQRPLRKAAQSSLRTAVRGVAGLLGQDLAPGKAVCTSL